jgi:endonuclease/exonuclease/phosphatase family metal-dependent hydrolase
MPIRQGPWLLLPVLAAAGCMAHGLPADAHIEAVVPAAPKAAELPRPMRVVELNVHMERGEKIVDALQHDPALRDADVIILEEIHRSNLGCSAACMVGKTLGFYSVYAPGAAAGDGDDGIAIVSRAPITSAQVIELPHFDVHINSGRRIALAATIERANAPAAEDLTTLPATPIAPGGAATVVAAALTPCAPPTIASHPITVYAVHLENRITVAQRRAQMLPVLEHATKQTTPVIIAGDFNTSPFTWIAHLLPIPTGTQDDKLEALVRAHGFATPAVGSGPTSRFLAMKLDAIYTRGFRTTDFATARASDLSDHLAMWAIVE